MIVYILTGAIIAILGALLYKKEKPARGLLPIFLILTLLMGLRGEMSEDHPEYNEFFQLMNNYDWEQVIKGNFVMERGFAILCKLISLISESPVFFMLVISIITVGLYTLVYKKSVKIPWLAMVLFFAIGDYFDSFNIVRNILAASICFFAISRYGSGEKKSFLKYLLLVLLASTMHTSALVMIPMYFVFKIKFSTKTLVSYLGVGVVMFLFLPKLIDVFMTIFPQYLLYGDKEIGSSNINAVVPTLGVFLFVVICVFFIKTDINLEQDENRMAMHGLTLALIFMIVSMQAGLAYRFAHFFKPFVAIAAVNTIAGIKSRMNRIVIMVAISIVAIFSVWIFYRESPYDPYYLHSEITELFR